MALGGGGDAILWIHHESEVDKIKKKTKAERDNGVRQCGVDWHDPDAANDYIHDNP